MGAYLSRVALLLVLAALPAAAALGAETRLEVIRDAAGVPQRIEIGGDWRGGCAPQLDEVRVDGNELTLLARPDRARCLSTGSDYRLQADIGELLDRSDATLWRLRYLLQDDPLSPPRLHAFALLPWSAGMPQAAPEDGFWWGEPGGEFDHAGPGLSAQIEQQGEMIALTFTGYDDEGRPQWLFGAAPLTAAATSIDLSRLDGGRGPFGGYRGPDQASSAGRVQVEWLSVARAVFWFSRPAEDGRGIELRPLSMVRFDFGQQPGPGWTGRWLFEIDGEAAAQPLRLSLVESGKDGFAMVGANGETLVCTRSARRPQSPPERCDLNLDADAPAWRFDDVGLNSLNGRDEAGRSVRGRFLGR
ncbi:MAG: hypothetical protein WCZ65_09145 [Lysobacteraceae bacterium]